MTRAFALIPLCAALAACDVPTPVGDNESALPAVQEAIVVPMDPGQIRCSQITGANGPAYLAEATTWAQGQMRASIVMGGLPGPVPDAATLSADMASYCSTYDSQTARDAYQALIAG